MDQKQTPSAAQPQKKTNSRIQSILKNRKLVIGIVIGLVVLVVCLGFVMSQRRQTDQASEKTYPLAAKEKFIVESVSGNKAQLTNSKGKRAIEDNKTTLIYQNLPPENKPAKFSDLKPQQEVDILEIKPNTIVYIIGAATEQNITVSKVEFTSSVANRTIRVPSPEGFKEQVQKSEWVYNTEPPQNITVNLVSTPQDVVFITGPSGNSISTSAAVDGQNAVVSLYINPSYIQAENPTLLSKFATSAVLNQIYKSFNPSLTPDQIQSISNENFASASTQITIK